MDYAVSDVVFNWTSIHPWGKEEERKRMMKKRKRKGKVIECN